MKKLILTLSFLTAFFAAFSQTNQVKVGIKAGLTLPTISANGGASAYDGPEPPDYKMNPSFYIGGIVDFPVSSFFSMQPGVTLLNKGAKYGHRYNLGPDVYHFDGKVNLMYIEVPVNGIFAIEVGKGKILLGGGPYYGMAISGRNKFESTITVNGSTTTTTSDRKLEFGSGKDFQKDDYGLNLLGGYELHNGLNIHVGYGIGFRTITGGNSNFYQEKNNVLSVGFGFSL
ncbi:outer membrane beta-barrel protein [Pedobacter aquatilis]|uniref:outer membrane beta-barrel protein n=1 Tax=Pedobacter aquatilis TaxID=351343 RepID=UPI00292CF937|nr:outer membrane beta-barrel protein [Pedobacter aquatilis]